MPGRALVDDARRQVRAAKGQLATGVVDGLRVAVKHPHGPDDAGLRGHHGEPVPQLQGPEAEPPQAAEQEECLCAPRHARGVVVCACWSSSGRRLIGGSGGRVRALAAGGVAHLHRAHRHAQVLQAFSVLRHDLFVRLAGLSVAIDDDGCGRAVASASGGGGAARGDGGVSGIARGWAGTRCPASGAQSARRAHHGSTRARAVLK